MSEVKCPTCGGLIWAHTWSRQIQEYVGHDDTSGDVVEYVESKIEKIECTVCGREWNVEAGKRPETAWLLQTTAERVVADSDALLSYITTYTPEDGRAHLQALATQLGLSATWLPKLHRRIQDGALILRFVWMVRIASAEDIGVSGRKPTEEEYLLVNNMLCVLGLLRISEENLREVASSAGVTPLTARERLRAAGIYVDASLDKV